MRPGESTATRVAHPRGVGERVAIVGLALITLAIWVRIYDFSQHRFFTVDEYQYGHATWLVAEGQIPYVDFYEHHFPLSYSLHALALPTEGDFSDRALWLRKVAFIYAAAASLALGVASWAVARSAPMALLCAGLPAAFGFGLMSAVDYRADGFAAFGWLIALSMLEANRVWRRRWVAAVCGLITCMAVLMTQKMVFLAGGALALMWLTDRLRASRSGAGPGPFLRFPVTFFGAAGACGGLFLAVGAVLGMLGPGWEYTIQFGFEHEALYHDVPLTDYTAPFLAETPLSTWPVVLVALLSLFAPVNRFWLVPVAVTVLGGFLIRAQFPYNYVLLCYLAVHCGVRGFIGLMEQIPKGSPLPVRPLVLLLPLAVVPDQLDFVLRATNNAHQLALLNKVQRFTGLDSSVIDGAGAALFRNHASEYWYHGSAHRKLWADYFENHLIDDFRASQSLFWIRDFRTDELPRHVRRYLVDHYVRAGGDLQALGFFARPTRDAPSRFEIDVVLAGDYFVHPIVPGSVPPAVASNRDADSGSIWIDGDRVTGDSVELDLGKHRVRVDRGATGYIISPLPARVFQDLENLDLSARHTPLFEYAREP
jgi:hypothetical protein